MIREDSFIRKMTARWETLGNCLNDNLQDNWRQLCRALNDQQEEKNRQQWQVLQTATGTGKTQGIAVYCSSLTDTPACGVLIVVRLIKQAEEVADLINELAGRRIARAKHTKNTLSPEESAATQVLVVTHKAYEISLNRYINGGKQAFEGLSAYGGSPDAKRGLIVIDECLDVVKQYQVDLEELDLALGAIPYHIKNHPLHSGNIAILNDLKDDLSKAAGTPKTKIVHEVPSQLPSQFSLTDLRAACRKVDWDGKLYKTESKQDKRTGADRIDSILEAAEATLRQWNYYSKKGVRHTLNTSLLVVPDEVQGAVVLDATASDNVIYELFEGRYIRMLKPKKARSYQNVTLHIARVSGVGKGKMAELKGPRTSALMDYLSSLPNTAKVFMCSHKTIEPIFASYQTPYELRLGHWGAIDGLNTYQDCDTFVCFGLPYRDSTSASNTYLAFKGAQPSSWLSDSSRRAHGRYTDILLAIAEGQMASDVIQAINRVRVRRVIDSEGNCAKSEGYLLLPTGPRGDRLLEAITRAMPDIKTQDWNISFDQGKPPNTASLRGHFSKSLIQFLENSGPGKWSASALQNKLCMPRARWKTIAAELRKPDSALSRLLASIGCAYLSEGAGNQSRSYVTKVT